MDNLHLPLDLFESTDTNIEITEMDGMNTGGILQYFDMKSWSDKTIQTCAGDITIIINALEDYARLLDAIINEWGLTGYHAALYEVHAARCRKISAKYQAATGYDYNAAVEKCKKRKTTNSDIGEESLTLLARRDRQNTKPQEPNRSHQKQLSLSI